MKPQDNALGADDIEHFHDRGFVVLGNAIPSKTLGGWQRQIMRYLGFQTWSEGAAADFRNEAGIHRSGNGFTLDLDTARLNDTPRIFGAVERLIPGSDGGSEQLIINWPREVVCWQPPTLGHIDFMPLSANFRFMLGVVIYVFDVAHCGGGFCVWPGSHRSTLDFFTSSPEEFGGHGTLAVDDVQAVLVSLAPSRPEEFIGKAGDALLWHGLLVHNVSMNASSVPRVAMFGRWGQKLKEGESQRPSRIDGATKA